MNTYKVKQEDLIGQLEGFPIEVVQKMVDEQVRQGNNADVSVFQGNAASLYSEGGFLWRESLEGMLFWNNIIVNRQFNQFFEKYPRTLGKAFEDHFQNTPKEVIKENWEKSKEKYACQVEEGVVIEDESKEDTFYKYYVSGVNIINKTASLAMLEEKGGRDTMQHFGSEVIYYLYYIDKKKEIITCFTENRDLLHEIGYIELKSIPETVEYNGKKYIKSEFEMAINHLKEM